MDIHKETSKTRRNPEASQQGLLILADGREGAGLGAGGGIRGGRAVHAELAAGQNSRKAALLLLDLSRNGVLVAGARAHDDCHRQRPDALEGRLQGLGFSF